MPTDILLRDALDDYLFEARALSPCTHTWYRQKLTAFAQWCSEQGVAEELSRLTAKDIRAFLDTRRASVSAQTGKPLSSYTLHGYAQVIKQFLRWAANEGYDTAEIAARVKLPRVDSKVIQTLNEGQIRALFDACAEERHLMLVCRDRAMVAVLLATGVRASELCKLPLAGVYLEPDDAFIRVMGKGRKEREIGLGVTACRYLRRYLRVRTAPKTTHQVFVGWGGKPMTPSGLDQMLYRLRDWAGARHFEGIRVSAHTLRHTFAVTYLAQPGSDIYKLSRLMGHSSIVTTTGYLRSFRERDARQTSDNPLDTLL